MTTTTKAPTVPASRLKALEAEFGKRRDALPIDQLRALERSDADYRSRVHVPDPTVPLASDDAAWDKLAKSHAPGCSWVRTRAHRLDDADTRS